MVDITKVVIPPQFRIIGWGLVIGLVVFLGWLWLQNRDTAKENKAAAEQGVRTDQAASGIAQDAGEIQQGTHRVEVIITDARLTYQRGYEDAKREDPTVRDWADQPIPQRLRDLARERRLARERSGCVGDGCPDNDGAQR